MSGGLGGGQLSPGPQGRRNDQSWPEQTWAILDGPAGHAMGYSVDRISPDDVVKTPDGNIRVTITGKLNGGLIFWISAGSPLANDCLDLPVRGDGSFRSLHGLRLSLANGDVEAHRTLIGRV
jgi:hypothetical protein